MVLSVGEYILRKTIPKSWHFMLNPRILQLKELYGIRILSAIWFITWDCNFKCPYCWQWAEPELYRKHYPIGWKKWVIAWNKIAVKFDKVVCGITGGEPFIYTDFLELLQELPSNMIYDITSNLSFNVERFLKIASKRCTGVVCSYHPANITNNLSYTDNFIQKVRLLKILPNTRVNFVAAPQNLKYYYKLKQLCEKYNIELHVDQCTTKINNSKSTKEELRMANSILSKDRQHSCKKIIQRTVMCSAGKNHILLHPNGMTYPCIKLENEYVNTRNTSPLIGNFFDENFSLRDKGIKCALYPKCALCDYDNIYVKAIKEH